MLVNSIVIKVASRCNLNCSYCYVYNLGDTTYLNQPKLMSYETVDILIDRVAEHCKENNLKDFHFIFHGGEPLLQKKEFYYYFVNESIKKIDVELGVRAVYSVQTNGILITKEWCEVFNELKIGMGISLDGYEEVNDKYRVDHSGRGSYKNVVRGLEVSKRYSTIKPGILSVIDVESDALRIYDEFKKLDISIYDLLWPHATHDIPVQNNISESDTSATPYADWLIKIFDAWYQEKHIHEINITIFDTFINLILGKENSGNEDFGIGDIGLLVIETNGDMEAVGALKICGNGFTKSGANIREHSFSNALETKLAKLYHKSHEMLPKKCTQCPISDICGGGHIHTRYSKENGFDNVSVYCKDFMKLISHIQNTMYDSLPEKYQTNMERVTLQDLENYFESLNLTTIENPEYANELSAF